MKVYMFCLADEKTEEVVRKQLPLWTEEELRGAMDDWSKAPWWISWVVFEGDTINGIPVEKSDEVFLVGETKEALSDEL